MKILVPFKNCSKKLSFFTKYVPSYCHLFFCRTQPIEINFSQLSMDVNKYMLELNSKNFQSTEFFNININSPQFGLLDINGLHRWCRYWTFILQHKNFVLGLYLSDWNGNESTNSLLWISIVSLAHEIFQRILYVLHQSHHLISLEVLNLVT